MRTQYEKLKEICDLVWFESEYCDEKRKIFKQWTWENEYRYVNPVEIIFTPDFYNKFWTYYQANNHYVTREGLHHWIFHNLNNPVNYLADILNIKK
jgi:hypothetical protein